MRELRNTPMDKARYLPFYLFAQRAPGFFARRAKKRKTKRSRTYAVGVLAGTRGPQAPQNLLFPPTCGGFAATGGWKKKGVLWRALPSKAPNRVTPKKKKYRCERPYLGYRVSPAIEKVTS